MITIFDLAKYILEHFGPMHPMKLQKLCYYAQAWTLASEDKPLFGEDFGAWANGPVCRVLYETMKMKSEVSTNNLTEGDSSKLTRKRKETISNMLRWYVSKDLHYLSELVRSEEPWIIARNGCSDNEACSNIIMKDSMQGYYLRRLQGFE